MSSDQMVDGLVELLQDYEARLAEMTLPELEREAARTSLDYEGALHIDKAAREEYARMAKVDPDAVDWEALRPQDEAEHMAYLRKRQQMAYEALRKQLALLAYARAREQKPGWATVRTPA